MRNGPPPLSFSRALRGSVAKHVETSQLSKNRFYELPNVWHPRAFDFNLPQFDAQVLVGKSITVSAWWGANIQTTLHLPYLLPLGLAREEVNAMQVKCPTSSTHSNQ